MSGKSPEVAKKVSENYFERINTQFEKELAAGNVKEDTLNILAKRNKEDFFSMVKDAFDNPLAALKYFGTKLFGKTFAKWSQKIKESHQTVSDTIDEVNKTAQTSYDKAKKVLNEAPKNLKALPVVGGVYKAGESVIDYLANNPEEARSMPKENQKEWWKSIMVKAGANPESVMGKGFIDLVMNKQTWKDIGENVKEGVTAEKRLGKLKKDIESGEFDKNQLFTGHTIDEAGDKVHAEMLKLKEDVLTFVKANPNTVAVLSAYLGYNVGLKRNGFKLASDFGKVLLKLAASPLLLAKNNKLKIFVILLGGFLIKDQTKWDEYTVLKVRNTRLPKNLKEFKDVIRDNKAFQGVKKGLEMTEKDLREAMGMIKSPKLVTKGFEDIGNLFKPESLIKNSVDFVGRTPEENRIMAHKEGFYGIQSYFKTNSDIERALGKDKYESLLDEFRKLESELGKDNSKWLEGLAFDKYESINKKYGEAGSFRFEKYGDYIRYVEYDKKQANLVIKQRMIGLNPDANDDGKRIAARHFNFNNEYQSIISAKFENASVVAGIPEGFKRTLRELFGSGFDNNEDLVNASSEKVKSGEATVIQDGDNFFLMYGKEYIQLPYEFTLQLGKKLFSEDAEKIEPRDIAVVYGSGLGFYTVWGGTKFLGNMGADGAYKLVTGFDRRIGRLPVRSAKNIAIQASKAALWPGTAIWNQGKFAVNTVKTLKEVRAEGIKNILKSSAGHEMLMSAKNSWKNGSVRLSLLNNSIRNTLGMSGELSAEMINNLKGLERIGNAKFQLQRQIRNIGKGNLDNKLVIKDLYKIFKEMEGGSDIWKRVIGTGYKEALSASDLKNLLGELDKVEVNKKAAIDTLKKANPSALKSGATYVADGVKSLGKGRMGSVARLGGKLLKSKKTAAIGAGLLGAYGLSEYVDEKSKNVSNVEVGKNKVEKKETEKKKIVRETALKIISNEGKMMGEYLGKTNLDRLSKLSNKELKTEIDKISTWYERAHNDLLNTVWKDYDIYNEDLGQLAKAINEEIKKHGGNVDFKLEDTSKWYSSNEKKGFSLMDGMMSISKEQGGGLEIGYISRPSMQTILKRKVLDHKDSIGDIATSLIPLVSSKRNLDNAADFYEDGNYEEVARELGYSVTNLALDGLGIVTLGGGKLVQGAVKAKKATKIVDSTLSVNQLSQKFAKLGKMKGDLALNSMFGIVSLEIGSKVFADEIDTVKVLKR